MASIGIDKRGSRYIQFEDRNRQRRTLRLGKVSQRTAEAARLRVEKLVAAQMLDAAPDQETTRWLAEIGDKVSGKLAKLGLIETRKSMMLGDFIKEFKQERSGMKLSTRTAWGAPHKSLLAYFSERTPLRSISEGQAKAWRRSIAPRLAENTVRKWTAIAKTLFNAAVEHRLIDRSPFAKLKSGMIENKARMHFVDAETSRLVLKACPDFEWRLIFALARWGGLRCPSEMRELKWSDILWDRDRFIVLSPKTVHQGKPMRIVPIFPELLPIFREAFEAAADGAIYVVPRTRNSAVNLRTQFKRIVERAGVAPWPKLFQNLRSTRETELANHYPIHVACEWIGNSRPVAMKHYLQATEDHFITAAGDNSAANALQRPAASDSKAMHGQQKTPGNQHFPGKDEASSGRAKTRTWDLYGVNQSPKR